ncbi:Cytoskeleton-associated protein 5 [Intoshia linei]|uniref:Cytoskeleton-associated protein 5 n=1 Tax=Intoshia linei TaxID=1819745 RepID=A0A177B888_9BILA|nr:Cytoskeleton-associated protein 5 [Intoshia linei]
MSEEEDTSWMKLSVYDKCCHKLWKARVDGYEKIFKVFDYADNDDIPEFKTYSPIIKNFVVETNPSALDKGLDAALAYITNAKIANKIAPSVLDGIIKKCLTGKPKIKEKCINIFMMVVEIEQADLVVKKLLECMDNKQPKIISGALQFIIAVVQSFGTIIINVKPFLKKIEKLLDNKDKTVRENTKTLVIECTRWLGTATIKPLIASLKPVVVTEFEKEFEKNSNKKAKPTRYIRSEMEKRKNSENLDEDEADDIENDDDEDESPTTVIDTFELLPSVDILSKLPKNFFAELESKNWKERQTQLQLLESLLKDVAKIDQDADYKELFSALKLVLEKEKTVALFILSSKILKSMGVCLKTNIQQHSVDIIQLALLRLKEKKFTIVNAMTECLDEHYKHVQLEAIFNILIESLSNKSTNVRIETLRFMIRIMPITPLSSYPKKLIKDLIVPLMKCLNDSLGDIRDLTMQSLGILIKIHGEKVINKYIDGVDKIKRAKIDEFAKNCQLISSKKNKPKDNANEPKKEKEKGKTKETKTVKEKPNKKNANNDKKPKFKKASPNTKKPNKTNKNNEKELPTENLITEDAALELLSDILKENIAETITNKQWKTRLECYQKILATIDNLHICEQSIPSIAILVIMSQKPGFKDSNISVLKCKYDVLKKLSETAKCTKTLFDLCISPIVDKIGDTKVGPTTKQTLNAFAERLSLQYTLELLCMHSINVKNPKTNTESLNWIISAVDAFGGKKISLKVIIGFIKINLSSKTPEHRKAASSLIAKLVQHVGNNVRNLIADEPVTVLKIIDEYIEKLKGCNVPEPTLGLTKNEPKRAGKSKSNHVESGQIEESGQENSSENENDDENEDALDSLIPRVNISDKINDSIFNEMDNSLWKVRSEAVKTVLEILDTAKFIEDDIGGLPIALSRRLGDSNKIIIGITLEIIKKLAVSIGPNVSRYIGDLWPGVMASLSDSKTSVRSNALAAMDEWLLKCKLFPLLADEMVPTVLSKENPVLRENLLVWLTKAFNNLKSNKKLPPSDMKPLVECVFVTIFDRNVKVRSAANEFLKVLQGHTSYGYIIKLTEKHKERDFLTTMVGKHREDLATTASLVKKEKVKPKKNTIVQENDITDDEICKEKVKPRRFGTMTKKTKTKEENIKSEEIAVKSEILGTSATKQARMSNKSLSAKWSPLVPTDAAKVYLNDNIHLNFSESLAANMVSNDFSLNVKAFTTLNEELTLNLTKTFLVIDLIVKWINVRWLDTNTTVTLRTLEFLELFVSKMIAESKNITDSDASNLIPGLLIKIGDSKESIKKKVRSILEDVCQLYPYAKLFNFVLEAVNTRNSRQRIECLELINWLLSNFPDMIPPSNSECPPIKLIASQLSDRDNNVRNAAIKSLISVYKSYGNVLFKMIGHLSKNAMDLLNDRLKRVKVSNSKTPIENSNDANNQVNHRNLSSYPENNDYPINAYESSNDDNHGTRPVSPVGSAFADCDNEIQNDENSLHEDSEKDNKPQYKPFWPKIENPINSLKLHKIPDLNSIVNAEDQLEIEKLINWKVPDLKKVENVVNILDSTVSLPPDKETENDELKMTMKKELSSKNTLQNYTDKTLETKPQKTDQLILYIIQSVRSSNNSQSLYSLKRIEHMLKDQSKLNIFTPDNMNVFIVSCAKKIQHMSSIIVDKNLVDTNIELDSTKSFIQSEIELKCFESNDKIKENCSENNLIESVFNYMIYTLTKFFQNHNLASSIFSNSLYNIMYNLIFTITCDEIINHFEIKINIRSISSLIGNVISMSNQSNIICALILLLANAIIKEESHSFIDLNMKCIWRILKKFNKIIQDLNVEDIFKSVSSFFSIIQESNINKTNGGNIQKSLDRQIQTIKTVVFTIVTSLSLCDKEKFKNLANYQFDSHNSILKTLITKCILKVQGKNYNNAIHNNTELQNIVELFNVKKINEAIVKLFEYCQSDCSFDVEILLFSYPRSEKESILSAYNLYKNDYNVGRNNVNSNLNDTHVIGSKENDPKKIIQDTRSQLDKLRNKLYKNNILKRPTILNGDFDSKNKLNYTKIHSELTTPLNTPRPKNEIEIEKVSSINKPEESTQNIKEDKEIDYLPRLPIRVLHRITNFLNIEDIENLKKVSIKMNRIFHDEKLWKKLYISRRNPNPPLELIHAAKKTTWHKLFYTNRIKLRIEILRARSR